MFMQDMLCILRKPDAQNLKDSMKPVIFSVNN